MNSPITRHAGRHAPPVTAQQGPDAHGVTRGAESDARRRILDRTQTARTGLSNPGHGGEIGVADVAGQCVPGATTAAMDREPWAGLLRGAILLGGGVGLSELRRGVDRPILDLPVEPGLSILDLWRREAEAMALGGGFAVRVLVDLETPVSSTDPAAAATGARITLERDRSEYRGTGGALRDACEAYRDDDVVLIAPAHQVLLEPLPDLAAELTACPADIAILASDDGVPSALMMARVAALRPIREVGFVDFKEQALPDLSRRFDVRVVRRQRAAALPVRTLDGYIDAVRAHQRRRAGLEPWEGPFAEDWVSAFGLVEPGAVVAPDARIHDSVVLRGGRVEPRAVLVRSLVCAGAEVAAGDIVADRLVTPRPTRNGRSP